jgi:hypothetical protein
MYLSQYRLDPAHPGIVFVSLLAGFPSVVVVLTHSATSARGPSSVPVGS